jgi:hypothetical protein
VSGSCELVPPQKLLTTGNVEPGEYADEGAILPEHLVHSIKRVPFKAVMSKGSLVLRPGMKATHRQVNPRPARRS